MKPASFLQSEELLSAYDHGQLRYAVAYGSGAIRQESYKPGEQPMLDLIFAVDRPAQWHAANMQRHPRDYSALRLLGSGAIAAVQEWGAGVYYNTYVRFGTHEIKYGVIATHRLIDDLLQWEHLYIAGRLQKPVQLLQQDTMIEGAVQQNLSAAIAATRLLLPETFSERQLYAGIAGLSYGGDVRMGIGENPRKVENIVNGGLTQFRELYAATLTGSPEISQHGDQFSQSMGTDVRAALMRALPRGVYHAARLHPDQDREEQRQNLMATLRHIVSSSSTVMTVKGLLTAGPLGAMRYAGEKIAKGMKR